MSKKKSYSSYTKVVVTIFVAVAIYLTLGIIFQVFLTKNAYYCPFNYGACGLMGREYLIAWLSNRIFWPLEVLVFIFLSLPGVELPL